ncbi:MAG: hypothetical protein HFE63_03580 [Clostridiales bacterium]|nr:hypothetical protein [Clostridiales bacterium]
MLEKIADKLGTTPQGLLITVAVIIVAFVLIWLKISHDEKKGVNSQEKAEIRNIISTLVPNGSSYTAAYASSTEYRGRTRIYRYFAIGYKVDEPDHLWMVPLEVVGGKPLGSQPFLASAETLDYVGGSPLALTINIKNDRTYICLSISESNTRMGKECQVNIQQPDETKLYREFAPKFQETVNEKLGVDKKGRKIIVKE